MDKLDKPCMGCVEESRGQERGEAGKGQPGEVSPPREASPPTGVQPRPSPAGEGEGPGHRRRKPFAWAAVTAVFLLIVATGLGTGWFGAAGREDQGGSTPPGAGQGAPEQQETPGHEAVQEAPVQEAVVPEVTVPEETVPGPEILPGAGPADDTEASEPGKEKQFEIHDLGLGYPESDVRYPYISGLPDPAVQEKVNRAIREAASYNLWDWELNPWLGLEDLEAFQSDPDTIWHEATDTTAYCWGEYGFMLLEENIISLVFDQFVWYTGAVRPHHLFYSVTLSLDSGDHYALGDLFMPGKDYKVVLESSIRAEINKMDIDLFEPYRGLDEGQGFYLSAQGLYVYYPVYKYTASYLGPFKIRVPYQALRGYFNPGFIFLAEM